MVTEAEDHYGQSTVLRLIDDTHLIITQSRLSRQRNLEEEQHPEATQLRGVRYSEVELIV